MTVINGMKFNENEGAIVADEQASTQFGRKYDTAEKLYDYSVNGLTLIVGGTGFSDILYDVAEDKFRKWFDNYTENSNKGEINKNGSEYLINKFNSIMLNKKRSLINDHLFSKYGYTEEDILKGYRLSKEGEKDTIHENVSREYFELLQNPEKNQVTRNAFLALTNCKNKVNMYTISMDSVRPHLIADNYCSLGSGSDSADSELSSFFNDKTRVERWEEGIDKIDGIVALINATETASLKNVGVGGLPYVKILTNGKVITPLENNTKLSTEIVKSTKKGYLAKEFQNESINTLLFDGKDFDIIEKQMQKESNNSKEMNLMLRGYKTNGN